MNEAQALKKWCPFARAFISSDNDSVGSFNRTYSDIREAVSWPSASACIGSRCMAWQETRTPRGFWVKLDGKSKKLWSWDPSAIPEYAGRVEVKEAGDVLGGRCGLTSATAATR